MVMGIVMSVEIMVVVVIVVNIMVLWSKIGIGVNINIVMMVHSWLSDIGSLMDSWVDHVLMSVVWASVWDILRRVSVLDWRGMVLRVVVIIIMVIVRVMGGERVVIMVIDSMAVVLSMGGEVVVPVVWVMLQGV